MKLEKERIRHRALLRVHPFAPAQSHASLASVTAHLIRPTHSTLGVGFGSKQFSAWRIEIALGASVLLSLISI
jgi:hypothetical protein